MANKRGDVFAFRLDGARELERVLEQLPLAVGKAVLRKAAIKAMKPVASRAADLAPVGALIEERGAGKSAGYYKKSFVVGTQLTRNQKREARKLGESSKSVNVYVGSTDRKAHLIEFGTGERYQRTTGPPHRRTGSVTAQPALRPAWDELNKKVLETFAEEISKNLLGAARRLAKKAIKGTLTAKEKKALQ